LLNVKLVVYIVTTRL